MASGMTLMEVVIAISVMAFAVPLIFTATTAASSSRLAAEADTRSVWLTREGQRQIILKWSDDRRIEGQSIITTDFSFPEADAESSTKTLIFDNAGKFISEGSEDDQEASSAIAGAAYVVSISAETYTSTGASNTSSEGTLAKVTINVANPAKTAPGKRSQYRYVFITTREGLL